MKRKILVSVCMLLCLCLYVQAQGTMIRVIDDSDNQPVPFCHICLENKETGKQQYHVGDVNGEALVELGENVILSVSAIGYQRYLGDPGSHSGQMGSHPGLLEIYLKPNYFDLDEVVVTGQYKPVSVDKSIYDIRFIGKTRIENQAANTMTELLSKELNFKINNDPSTGSSLNLQGMSGENVKILVDGVPVIGRLDGNIDLSQINLENVDHIEIIEGPMSVIYGSNALAGVVNIITTENKYARYKANIHGYYESVGVYNLNENVDVRLGNHNISYNGGRNFFGGYSLVDTSRSKEWKPKEQYNAGITYRYAKNGTALKYKVSFFRENLLDRNNPFPPYHEKGNDTWFTTTRFNNSLHLNKKLSESNDIHLLAAYSYYDRRKAKYLKDLTTLESVLVTDPAEHDTSLFHAITARGGFNHATEQGSLDYQAGFDINTEYGQGKRMKNGEEYIGDYALFASIQWHPARNFTFQPALRVSYNTKYKSPLTPSLNIKYQQGKTIFRLSYARGFRAPSLKELYLNFYDSNHQIEGNEGLVAERSHNYNMTVTNNSSIADKPVELKAKAYYNVINDRISLVQVDPDNPLHYKNANTDHFESMGGDLSMGVHPLRHLSVNAGVSYIGRKDSYYKTGNFVFSTSAITNITLKLLKNNASVSMFYKYSGRYPVHTFVSDDEISLNYLDAYHNMDINFSVKLFRQQLRLTTGVKNLFDNTMLVGISSGSGHGGGDGVSSLVGWGRTVFLGVNYYFTKY
ncbi:MAG: TonB-dependent receptor [Bacteroidales bacterium]|nr:TonB-dependent receptor [Bacteroidales bacterium]